jgi:ABC-2 type transport system permease protein
MKEILRAAMVIGRRDFTAIIMSKAFILFLLGPLFPVLVGIGAGSLGEQIARDTDQPMIGLAMRGDDSEKMLAARAKITEKLGADYLDEMKIVGKDAGQTPIDPKSYLAKKTDNLSVVVTGTLANPVITGTPGFLRRNTADIELVAGHALSPNAVTLPKSAQNIVVESANSDKKLRTITGQAAQAIIFLLTMLLAGMVLSNLVEEKANKIIEILAASIPMESVFLGKLFAMLAMSVLGIAVWFTCGFFAIKMMGTAIPVFPTPAVGWTMFVTLAVVYFALAYLMLGALFLGIGAMATTVREVQTLSMPVTMLQMVNFFFATYTVSKIGQPIEQAASIFPFSSPFAMIARAAQEPTLWHHGIAIIGQIMFVVLLLRLGVFMFKRNVMKSGSGGKITDGNHKRKLFGLIPLKN